MKYSAYFVVGIDVVYERRADAEAAARIGDCVSFILLGNSAALLHRGTRNEQNRYPVIRFFESSALRLCFFSLLLLSSVTSLSLFSSRLMLLPFLHFCFVAPRIIVASFCWGVGARYGYVFCFLVDRSVPPRASDSLWWSGSIYVNGIIENSIYLLVELRAFFVIEAFHLAVTVILMVLLFRKFILVTERNNQKK